MGRRQMEVERALDSGRHVSLSVWKPTLPAQGAALGLCPLKKGRCGERTLSITRVIKPVLAQPACLPGVHRRGTSALPTHLLLLLCPLSLSSPKAAWLGTCFVSLPRARARKVTYGRSLAQPQQGEIPRLLCQPCPASLPAWDTLPRSLPCRNSSAGPPFRIHWQRRPLPEQAVGAQLPGGFGAASPKLQWGS